MFACVFSFFDGPQDQELLLDATVCVCGEVCKIISMSNTTTAEVNVVVGLSWSCDNYLIRLETQTQAYIVLLVQLHTSSNYCMNNY